MYLVACLFFQFCAKQIDQQQFPVLLLHFFHPHYIDLLELNVPEELHYASQLIILFLIIAQAAGLVLFMAFTKLLCYRWAGPGLHDLIQANF